jgi:PAS domain S-box-containing protein
MHVTTSGGRRFMHVGTRLQWSHRRLAETRRSVRELLEVARLASWEWQPDSGEIVFFDVLNADTSHTRAQLDELLGALPAAEREDVREDFATLVRGEREELVRRHRYPTPNGSTVLLEVRARAVRDEVGALVCVRGVAQQVSARELGMGELLRARDFFQGTLDSLPAHIAVLDELGGIIMTNRAWSSFASANHAGAAVGIGANYLAACDAATEDELASRAGAALRAIIAGTGDDFTMEYPCHAPAAERWFALRAARYNGPGPARVVVAHDDITTRRQAQAEVATQAALLDEVDVSVIATDPEGLVTHWNRGAEHLYGWARVEAMGRSAAELIVPAGGEPAEESAAKLRRDGHWEGAFTACRKDGSTFPASVRDRLILDARGLVAGTIGVSVDMTERVASERALAATRNYMRAIGDSMGEGLITLDRAGRFIYLNAAAEALLGWSREELRGRVMHEVTHSRRPDGTARPVAECPIARARREGVTVRVEDDLFIGRDGRFLPVAYTAAPFVTDDGTEGCAVVVQDITERKARQEDLEHHVETLSWISRVREALAKERFVLYAQPIIDVRSGEVVQRELLLRIREPSGEIVVPSDFLPVAEEYGLIGDIDRWVISRASEIAAASGAVELNISAHSMGDRTILDHIEKCLQRTGADPTHLVFEVTETALVADQAAAVAFASRLHALGCKLALDDFGTGYGGFTYLKRFTVDYLKIDVEFVRDLPTNPASRHVVEAVATLARAFNLKTVAEGVEDAATLALLRELGVEFAQGYHIARPAAADSHATSQLLL